MNKIIGLIDVDFKRNQTIYNVKKIFPNLALMKISAFYKNEDYKVEWYSPLFKNRYDKVFASKVFNYDSEMAHYIPKNAIVGGTGFNLKTKLSNEIEHIYPDYELYGVDFSLGFITRGCIRDCKFCVVREKEGNIRKNANIWEFTKDQESVMLLDNNILAYKKHLIELEKLKESKKRIDFNQGLDIRLITEQNAQLLKEVKQWKGFSQIRFAFDDINLKSIVKKKLEILFNAVFSNRKIMFYLLIGFNSTEDQDLERIEFLKEMRIDPYVMPYDLKDPYQKMLRDYVNYKKIFWKVSWMEYKNNYKEIKKGKLRNILSSLNISL